MGVDQLRLFRRARRRWRTWSFPGQDIRYRWCAGHRCWWGFCTAVLALKVFQALGRQPADITQVRLHIVGHRLCCWRASVRHWCCPRLVSRCIRFGLLGAMQIMRGGRDRRRRSFAESLRGCDLCTAALALASTLSFPTRHFRGRTLDALHDGPERDVAPVTGSPRLVCRVAKLGLKRFDCFEVQLQLPDQAGAWDPYVQLQVAVPGRGLCSVVLAVESVFNLRFAQRIR